MKKVIAIFDVGKTNKKLLLLNEQYHIVFEKSVQLPEIKDEDDFPCEDVAALKDFVTGSLKEILDEKKFDVKAVNFSGYGASLVYLDEKYTVVTPLYNYLKPYPEELSQKFYSSYGGETNFAVQTASPVSGSLNSGLQLYRIKYEHPELFQKIKYALHLPQYLAYIVSGLLYSDITSIGCHTNLWNFSLHFYHDWLAAENVLDKMLPLIPSDKTENVYFSGYPLKAGTGLHDSSAALIPYLINFKEPFILISTGTWCITLNPFNETPLTKDELDNECLCYLQHNGNAVKAARLFAGYEHEEQVKRIADHFKTDKTSVTATSFDATTIAKLQEKKKMKPVLPEKLSFKERALSAFADAQEAYHRLIMDLVAQQLVSTGMVLEKKIKRIFVDGGFSKNDIYMNLLANAYPDTEVYATFMGQASALGAALIIHDSWNTKTIPSDIIELKYYSSAQS